MKLVGVESLVEGAQLVGPLEPEFVPMEGQVRLEHASQAASAAVPFQSELEWEFEVQVARILARLAHRLVVELLSAVF